MHEVMEAFSELKDVWRSEFDALSKRHEGLATKEELVELEDAAQKRIDEFDVRLQTGVTRVHGDGAVDQRGPFLGPEVKSLASFFGVEPPKRGDDEVRIGAIIAAQVNPSLKAQLREQEQKALAEGTGPGGAYLLSPELATMTLERVLPLARVRQAGATVLPMRAPTVYLVGFDSGFVPKWRGEGGAFSDTTPTARRIALNARSLAAEVTVTIEQNDDVANLADQIESELARGFAQGFDLAALAGAGSDNEPLGLLNIADINTTSLGAAPANFDFLAAAVSRVRENNHEPGSAIYSARTAGDLDVLKDLDNNPLGKPESVENLRRLVSNNVPNNLGAAENESAAIVGDFSRLILGVRNEMLVQVDPYSKGNTGEIVIRAYARGDVAVTHFEAFEIVDAIQS